MNVQMAGNTGSKPIPNDVPSQSVLQSSTQSPTQNVSSSDPSALPGVHSTSESSKSDKQQQQADHQKVQKLIDDLNQKMLDNQTHFQFKLFDKLHTYYVQIVNEQNKVVAEIPPKKVLESQAAFLDYVGMIMNKKV